MSKKLLKHLEQHKTSRNNQEIEVDWDIEVEVYNLKHLNDLGITITTQRNLNKLLSLSNQNLQMCTRRLQLFSSPSSLPSLSSLSSPSSSSTTTTLGVDDGSIIKSVEKLELLANLETLSIHFFNEAELMNMNHQYHLRFQNLTEIEIWSFNALKDLTWVGYVGNLKKLEVLFCKEIEEIVIYVVDESKKMMNNVEDIFKCLKTLVMRGLPKLKSICRNALAFPCLESMQVYQCPELKKLPFDSGSNINNTLQEIRGKTEWLNALQWEEDHDNNELLKSKFLPLS